MTSTKPKPPAQQQARKCGRPQLGSFRLECMLPRKVLDELMRHENETGLYRTRIAANVLCNWARESASSHSFRRPSA
jgi:hypothetical protein